MDRRTYLDWNATAPLRPEVRNAMLRALDIIGNPSSVHAEGRAAREAIETARVQVANLIGATAEQVVFTSGASEAASMVIAAPWGAVAIGSVEHDCMHAAASIYHPTRMRDLRVDGSGQYMDAASLVAASRSNEMGDCVDALTLTVMQLANNETGIVQEFDTSGPSGTIGVGTATRHSGYWLCDAVQAAGRMPVDFAALGCDAMVLSAHKIGGPKGIGALVLKAGTPVARLIGGGSQENRRRAGTENLPAIVGFGAAAASCDVPRDAARMQGLRDRLERHIRDVTPDAVIIGSQTRRLPNTTCVALPGARSETLVMALDLEAIAVSAGAACSSGKVARSHVLAAMHVPDDLMAGAIRISIGWATCEEDISRFARAWETVTRRLGLARTGSRAA